MKVTIFIPPFPGWTSLLCPSPCGAGGKVVTVKDSFFLLLLPPHVFPLLWHKLPSGPALEQALCLVQFLQGISTWLGAPPPSPSLTLMVFCCFSLLLFSFILFCGIFCPFLNTVSQRCCQFCRGLSSVWLWYCWNQLGLGQGNPWPFPTRATPAAPLLPAPCQL